MGRDKKRPFMVLKTGLNKSRMLSNFIKITTLFSVFYILVSWMIGFHTGMFIMSCNTFIFLVNLWLFDSGKISFKVASNFYIANCLFVAILLCTFYSGGIFSPVLPWFILIPTISLLLLGICRVTVFWLLLSISIVLAYGILGHIGYEYPNNYNHQFWDKIFTTTCVFGLVLIVYLVTHIFESVKQKALLKLAEKNKEITDGIYYARYIQQAMLAPASLIDKHLPDNFIIYKPKDIVSGDFYWAREDGEYFYLAVCDCTGHGVPGAFMSLLITSFLNEAITEKSIYAPNEILNFVRVRIMESTSKNNSQDGMDGTVMCLHKPTGHITYASANSNVALIRDNELTKLPKDKMHVGFGSRMDSFTLFESHIEKGDMFYFYSDGFPDLFGGPKGKKYSSRRFNQKLLMISHLDVKEQKRALEDSYISWKGDLEQIDDICVFGFRYDCS
jgi:serine phosphatase RsbU (regulator of sigma subunit)